MFLSFLDVKSTTTSNTYTYLHVQPGHLILFSGWVWTSKMWEVSECDERHRSPPRNYSSQTTFCALLWYTRSFRFFTTTTKATKKKHEMGKKSWTTKSPTSMALLSNSVDRAKSFQVFFYFKGSTFRNHPPKMSLQSFYNCTLVSVVSRKALRVRPCCSWQLRSKEKIRHVNSLSLYSRPSLTTLNSIQVQWTSEERIKNIIYIYIYIEKEREGF